MTNSEKQASGRPFESSASGTNHFRRTRVEESRVSRLHHRANSKGSLIRRPVLDFRREIYAALLFLACFAAAAALYSGLTRTGIVDPESDHGLMLAFVLGFLVAGGFVSTLAVIARLGHWLLVVAAASALGAVLATAGGTVPLETIAKLLFAASSGLWIGMMLTSIAQIVLISGLIIIVDFYSVFLGPTRQLLESGSSWIDYFTINLPVFGADAVSKIGVSDLVFFSLFLACTLTYRLRRITTALAMTASFIGTMIIGVTLNRGVPALPFLSVAFLLSNADLLYRRFLEEPDELKNSRRR